MKAATYEMSNNILHTFHNWLKSNPCPAQLQFAGGLQPLVNLLRAIDKEVLHNACLTINVCAGDEPTAAEICKYG